MRIELFMKDLVSRKDIHDIATKLELNESSSRKLLKTAFPPPSLKVWKEFAEKVLLLLGVVFILAGIIFFFAYNWRELHRFVKLSLVAGLLLSTGVGAAFLNANRSVNRIFLVAVFILTGLLMALYGQIYQTGANAYDLFLNWALLMIPLTILSNYLVIWILWLFVLNLALYFFTGQVLRDWTNPYWFSILASINIVAICIYEILAYRQKFDAFHRWFVQLIGLLTCIWLVAGTIVAIFKNFENIGYVLIFLMTCIAISGTFLVYRKLIKDLSFIAFGCLSVIAIVFSGFLRMTDFESHAIFFGGGFIIMLLTTLSVMLLLRIKKSWDIGKKLS